MKLIIQSLTALTLLNMINAEESYSLAIIKINEGSKYIEINIDNSEQCIRVVNVTEIQRVNLSTDSSKRIGQSIINTLINHKSSELGTEYPLAIISDHKKGIESHYDVNSNSIALARESIDKELESLNVISIAQLLSSK